MNTATQTVNQRHCRYCNEVVINARPFDELKKKHKKITCAKCQAERERAARYSNAGKPIQDNRLNLDLKVPVIKEGYSEYLCSKCGSYRKIKEYNTKRGVRQVAVCAPCTVRRGQELKQKKHELGLVIPIDQARAQKAAAVFGENYCKNCGSLKIVKTYNTKKGVRNMSFCMECKKSRDIEHAKKKTPEKIREATNKYKNSEKGRAMLERRKGRATEKAIEKRKELMIGKYSMVFLWSCSICGVKKVRRHSRKAVHPVTCPSCKVANIAIKNTKPPKIKICKLCNTTFQTKGFSVHCKSCIEYNKHIAVSLSVPSKGSYYSRAKLSGAPYEIVNRKKVYERDKYTCYICSCKVVISDKYVPNRASIDHVVPLSKGGGHTYSNIKTCCVLCNAVKGDRVANRVGQGGINIQGVLFNTSQLHRHKNITIKTEP